jgi:hypothetical protein
MLETVDITVFEEAELEWYFGLDLPGTPGEASTFGAMCSRLQMQNYATSERPSEGAPWTEIIACKKGSMSCVNDVEDQMAAFLDARRRAKTIREALKTLTAAQYGALQSRYGGTVHDERLISWFGDLAGVALVTKAAEALRRERATMCAHASTADTLAGMTIALKSKRTVKAERAILRRQLEAVRREASAIIDSGRAAYARARRGLR